MLSFVNLSKLQANSSSIYIKQLCFALATSALFALWRNDTNNSKRNHQVAKCIIEPIGRRTAPGKPIASSVVNPYGNSALLAGSQHHLTGVSGSSQPAQQVSILNKQTNDNAGLEEASWKPPQQLVYEIKRRKQAK